MSRVIVVGGGYAGLSAATALAEEGFSVELLESRGVLGGRAYSIGSSETFPFPVDNGPHLFMGCYVETLKMFKRLGMEKSFHWLDPLSLSWLTAGGKKVSLHCAPLPAPLHLVWGLLISNAFPWGEKIAMSKALGCFSKKPFRLNPGVETVAEFLEAASQGPLARERFWIPLCNAVMNVPIETAPIKGLGEVLRRVFFGSRRDSALGVARMPLSEMLSSQALQYLESKGAKVALHEGAREFKSVGKSFEIKTKSDRTLTADALILALPPAPLAALLGSFWNQVLTLEGLGKSPIVSVHMILDRPVFQEHFIGLSGAKFEWVFNRRANWGLKEPGQYLSFTASAAADLARLKDPDLTALAFKELQDRCPEARQRQVLHAKVTREMAATFIWNKETDGLRLQVETPFPGVFLAGDWTATGLPATLEGASLSGHLAAEKVREYLA